MTGSQIIVTTIHLRNCIAAWLILHITKAGPLAFILLTENQLFSLQHVVSHYIHRYDIIVTDKTTNYKPA
jgi:hypothetical protein